MIIGIKQKVLGKIRGLLYPRHRKLVSRSGRTLVFRVYNLVEDFRTTEYGGEIEFLGQFLDGLVPDDIVFDIGASVGLVAVHAADLLPKGKVFAFEPDPETCGRLFRNARLNKLDNLEIVTWAVTDSRGEIVLFTDGSEGFAPSLMEQTNRQNAPSCTIRVWADSLDHALRRGNLPLPSVLKIDVEGAEIMCLRGARGLLKGEFGQKPRLLFLEAHPEFLPRFGGSLEDLLSLIKSEGYEMVWNMAREAQIHYCFGSQR